MTVVLAIVLAPLPARILDRIVEDPTGCWIWTGSTAAGYGSVSYRGAIWSTHRLAWTLANRDIPPGMDILHACDCRACMNPEHLRLGTAYDNAEDMVSRGRQRGGPNQPNHPRKA